MARIRFSVSVPVLSVQITSCRAERLDRAEPLHERAAPGERRDADGQRERDRRQQPLGHVGDEQADREARPRPPADSPAASMPIGQEREPDDDGDERDQPGDAADLRARAGSARSSTRCGQRGDPAELGLHPGRVTTSAVASPPVQVVPLKTRSRASSSGPGRVDELRPSGRPAATRRSASRGRPRARPSSSRASAETRSPSARSEHVAGHELAAPRPSCARPSRRTRRVLRQVAAQRLDRPLGLPLLRRTRSRVQQDRRRRSRSRAAHAGGEGEGRRGPEEQRERMGELAASCAGQWERVRRSSSFGP